ncbi:MAG: hypothetical protein CW338_10680 [Clostridiales bacterium]|nr:hypothetical protein [Clostridiales bacterium]
MNEKVQAIARELAKEIASSKEFICMRMAEDAASNDPQVTDFAAKYYEKRQELEGLTAAENPDFDKMGQLTKELDEIQTEMKKLPLAAAMQRAQQEFQNMMNMVNQELSMVLSPEGASSSCSGHCEGCHGCDH